MIIAHPLIIYGYYELWIRSDMTQVRLNFIILIISIYGSPSLVLPTLTVLYVGGRQSFLHQCSAHKFGEVNILFRKYDMNLLLLARSSLKKHRKQDTI